ncbi:MAG: dihydrofolate reductase family protein [Actinomycetota bacterium]|nr:dihydrofolate reductase family protein [Actinomycetota bacterium]
MPTRRGTCIATRRVILQELTSVDSFVAGPSGGLEFFDAVSDYSEVDQDNLSLLGDVDTILLGRETYRMFVEYWPTAEGEPVATRSTRSPRSCSRRRWTVGRGAAGSRRRAGLVDEIQLRVIPIVLGSGRSLVTADTGGCNLDFLEAKPYTSGVVSLRYAVARS